MLFVADSLLRETSGWRGVPGEVLKAGLSMDKEMARKIPAEKLYITEDGSSEQRAGTPVTAFHLRDAWRRVSRKA